MKHPEIPNSLLLARNDFPILQKARQGKPFVYLDNAATTQKPNFVIDAIADFYRTGYATVHRAVYHLSSLATKRYQEVRKKVATFVHAAQEEEIVFTKGTTEGINLIATTFGETFLHPGDEVIVTEMEHHANLLPWQRMCAQRGAVLKFLPLTAQGALIPAQWDSQITSTTKLIAVAHVGNVTGMENPIRELAAAAHRKGAALLVDGAQAAPHLRIDVQKLDADFYLFSGHKLYGPTGIGVLYGKKKWLNQLPPYQLGGDMVDQVTKREASFHPPPLRFEAGTPMIAEVIGLGAAIDYLEQIGFDVICAHENELCRYAAEQFRKIPGITLLGDEGQKGPILSFAMEGIHPLDLGVMLDTRGIAIRTGHQCAQTALAFFGLSSVARLSLGLYNTFQEIDYFFAQLESLLPRLRG